MLGIDLFSGAGGMSVGATMAGVHVSHAVELDLHAAATFQLNHPETTLIQSDIRAITAEDFTQSQKRRPIVVFGGPPCQGFSISNQKNRDRQNSNNWLYTEYLRLVEEIQPDWIIFENVKGIIETEHGFFLDAILSGFREKGYTTSHFVLNSANFGVPQKRNRLFIIGSLHGITLSPPVALETPFISVKSAISDLPDLNNGDTPDLSPYADCPPSAYAQLMRGSLTECHNNIVTHNAPHIIQRYKHVPQGGNWANIPPSLMDNYTDVSRCHTGIYKRLRDDQPSVVIGNFRKNMLIHPWKDRGLSVREAARLQSIPDWFRFTGSIGFQQQQVGNLVPPLLAKAVFELIMDKS